MIEVGSIKCVGNKLAERLEEDPATVTSHNEDEIFFVFKMRKKGKSNSKFKKAEHILSKKKNSKTKWQKDTNESVERPVRSSYKKVQAIDPSNPFSALLELKRKL